MAKIIVSYHRPFVPLVRQLIAQGHEVIALQPQFAQELKNLDLEVQPLMEFNTSQIQTMAFKESAALIHSVCNLNGKLNTDTLLPQLSNFIHNGEFAGLLYPKLGDLALLVLCLDSVQPDLFICHNDVEPLLRCAALWYRQNEKPCLHVPHAIYQNIENKHDIHSIITASHLASSGPYQTAWYVKRGFSPANIAETGLPQFDDFAKATFDQKRARQLLDLDPFKAVVTFASSWRQNTNMAGMHDGISETCLAILECAKAMPNVQFVIKAHPRDQQAQWHVDEAEKAKVKVAVTAQHLPIVLQASDAVLAYGPSNVLLEGCHIPWLRLACTSGYEQDQEVVKINTDPPNVEQMVMALRTLLQTPPLDTFGMKRKYLGPCDGHNSDRVGSLIGQLC